MLLDEPLAALDRQLRGQMQLELKRLQHQLGTTFLVVTHDQEEALVMADRIAVLDKGQIAQEGPPQDLYEHPASRFVATFLGETNLFEGTTVPGGVEVPGFGLLRADHDTAGAAALSIRPERIRIGEGGGNRLTGTVADIAYRGTELMVMVALEGRAELLAVRLPAGTETTGLAPGSTVSCVWKPEDSRVIVD